MAAFLEASTARARMRGTSCVTRWEGRTRRFLMAEFRQDKLDLNGCVRLHSLAAQRSANCQSLPLGQVGVAAAAVSLAVTGPVVKRQWQPPRIGFTASLKAQASEERRVSNP